MTMLSKLIVDLPWPDNPGTRSAIGPMPDATSSAAIADLTRFDRPLIVMVASSSEAQLLERELPLRAPPMGGAENVALATTPSQFSLSSFRVWKTIN